MKKNVSGCIFACLLLLLPGFTGASRAASKASAGGNVVIRVKTDRASALYACGESAKFLISLAGNGAKRAPAAVSVTLLANLSTPVLRKTVHLDAGGSALVAGTLDRPGFLLCSVSMKGAKTVLAGAGFEPEKIQPVTKMPADFDAFWKKGRERLAGIPLDVQLVKLEKKCNPKQNSYRISFANIDNTRIYGFLSVPVGRPGPFPALVTVPGAGPGYSTPSLAGWAARGVLGLVMNVHAYDPSGGNIKEKYRRLNAKGMYMYHGLEDPETLYFRRAILGVDRALNYLASRPDFDRKHLVVYGSSQGGGFSLILSGLNHDKVTATAANVPALCDHMAYLDGRQPGWPKYFRQLKDESRRQAILPYFDAVNFAREIESPVIMSAGFIDRTCAPNSVYAAYNVISTPKRIFNETTMGHAQSRRYSQFLNRWLSGQLGLGPVVPPTR